MNTKLMKFLSSHCVHIYSIVILFPVILILIHHPVASLIQIPTHKLKGSQFWKFRKKKKLTK